MVCWRSGRSRGPTVESRTSRSSCRSRPSTVSTFIHGAASSRASGNPSSRRQIAATAAPFPDVRRNSGCTSRTRSRKRRTAGARARSAGDIASEPACNSSGPTAYSRSPRTRSGARLVTSTRSGATVPRSSPTKGEASSTCSKLSSTSNVGRSPQAPRTRIGRSAAMTSDSPSASAMTDATKPGSRVAANGTNATRMAESAAMVCAISSARRVFPAPPGPVSVISRTAGSASHCRNV